MCNEVMGENNIVLVMFRLGGSEFYDLGENELASYCLCEWSALRKYDEIFGCIF